MSFGTNVGERLYRRVMERRYLDDGKSYEAGCVCICGDPAGISIVFYRYEIGKGVVGFVKPPKEMREWLREYGGYLKDWIIKRERDRRAREAWWRVNVGDKVSNISTRRRPRFGS